MLVSDALTAFLAHVAETRSPLTLRAYRGRLKSLPSAMTDIAEFTADRLDEWLAARALKPNGQPAAPDTIRLTLAALDQFQAWMVGNKCLSMPIVVKARKPSGRQRELLPTKAETRLLLEHSPRDFSPIYRALRLTGARPGELCGSTIIDIDERAGEIVLARHKTARKTGKPRRIAIGHPALVELIRLAIGERTAGPIFLRSNGHAWTTDTLSATYRRARKAAGLPQGLVLYLTRHEHATELYRSTKDLKSVADALGHTQLSTTMRYTRVDAATLKSNQQLFNEDLDAA